MDRMNKIRESYTHHHEEVLFYFRGEPQCGWKLRPSVMRGRGRAVSERKMLVDLVSRRPEDFREASSALAEWVLAQHHGLKTRFLDITSNPLVALFHACETDRPEDTINGRLHVFAAPGSIVKPFNSDSVSVVANFAKLSSDDQKAILTPFPVRTVANFGTRWGEEEAITHELHLVLLDLMLPGSDGIDLMRGILETADVPVIFLSVYGQEEVVAWAFDMGPPITSSSPSRRRSWPRGSGRPCASGPRPDGPSRPDPTRWET